MINKISNHITDKFLSSGIIDEKERELYIYGLFVLISHFMYLTLTCFVGLLFKCFVEIIIFYVAFQLLRRYAGGFHADTETICEILSTLTIVVSIGIIKLPKPDEFNINLLLLSIISFVLVCILCPLDTPEKPLSEKEFKCFRKISWLILFVIILLIVLSYCFRIKFAFVPLCMSLILESILLIAGKIKSIVLKRKECRN